MGGGGGCWLMMHPRLDVALLSNELLDHVWHLFETVLELIWASVWEHTLCENTVLEKSLLGWANIWGFWHYTGSLTQPSWAWSRSDLYPVIFCSPQLSALYRVNVVSYGVSHFSGVHWQVEGNYYCQKTLSYHNLRQSYYKHCTSYLEKKTSELLPLDSLIARVITQTTVHWP